MYEVSYFVGQGKNRRFPSYKSAILNLDKLADQIICNPDRKQILLLHTIDKKQEPKKYRDIKTKLSFITPNCHFDGKKGEDTVSELTGIFYFDIDVSKLEDHGIDLDTLKASIINNPAVCMAGKSIGGKGLFFYVKVNTLPHRNNFEMVYDHLAQEYFSEIGNLLDANVRYASTAHFVPYDPELFYEPSRVAALPESVLIVQPEPEKKAKSNSTTRTYKKRWCVPIKEVRETLHFNLMRPDIDGQEFVHVAHKKLQSWHPKVIKDGQKRTTFRRIIRELYAINKQLFSVEELDVFIFSFIHYLNCRHTAMQPMNDDQLQYIFDSTFEQCKKGKHAPIRISKLAIDHTLPVDEKMKIAYKQNGIIRKNKSIERIRQAVEAIEWSGKKATQKAVLNYLADSNDKVGERTIKTYWKEI